MSKIPVGLSCGGGASPEAAKLLKAIASKLNDKRKGPYSASSSLGLAISLCDIFSWISGCKKGVGNWRAGLGNSRHGSLLNSMSEIKDFYSINVF